MGPSSRRTAALVIIVALAPALASGCGEPPPHGPSTTLADQPHALDHYAELLRRQLTDSDPVAIQRQISCEVARIANAFGTDEAQRRLNGADDSVFRSPEARARRAAVEDKLVGQSFGVGGADCDSLNAIWDRRLPLKPTAEAERPPHASASTTRMLTLAEVPPAALSALHDSLPTFTPWDTAKYAPTDRGAVHTSPDEGIAVARSPSALIGEGQTVSSTQGSGRAPDWPACRA